MLFKGDTFRADWDGNYYTVKVHRVRKDGLAVVHLIPANGEPPIRALYRDGQFAYYPSGKGGRK